jgi:hypothetical protein
MKKMSMMLVVVLIVGLVPSLALAQEEAEGPEGERLIELLKERAEEAVEQRLETIERVGEGLEEAEHLWDEHERVLIEELDAAGSGLTELGRRIEGADTLEELRELIPKIFEDYRIYAVVVPKAKSVVVADTIGAAVDRLELIASSLEDAIARLAAAGFDTSEAEAAVTAMKDSLAEADTLAGPVADTVLPLTPADWPDPAQSTLEGAQFDLRSARDAVESAVRSAREAGRILRDLLRL